MSVTITEPAVPSRTSYLADLIVAELNGTVAGHCVRVNYLRIDEAEEICRHLDKRRRGPLADLHVHVLTTEPHTSDPTFITADRAIELRNRKSGGLCLFVPPDLVDATASSLGNSFATIDGRDLVRAALDVVRRHFDEPAGHMFQSIQSTIARSPWVSNDDRLDLALATAQLQNRGELDRLGLELWRVGLIADARPEFTAYLGVNRDLMSRLARPRRIGGSYRERIASLGVTDETARRLEAFFARRALHDVPRWSRALIDADLTLDTWEMLDNPEASDLETLHVRPFTDASGTVINQTRLRQHDGPGGALFAHVGQKERIVISWDTEPRKTPNVAAWRVELVPADTDHDDDGPAFELPSRQVKGDKRRADLTLDFELGEMAGSAFRARVTPVSDAGVEIVLDNEPISALSEEFYLLPANNDDPEITTGTRRRTVGTLAEGRLIAALESKISELVLEAPQWSMSGEVAYFSLRVQPKTELTLALSPLLLELERATLAESRSGGRWQLSMDEVIPATIADVHPLTPPGCDEGVWLDFWRARASFFDRIRKAEPRDVVETADWTNDQLNAAIRYAQAYQALLDTVEPDALQGALSIDTLSLKIDRGANEIQTAAVVLPTHPLRAAWFAVHASLLRAWEPGILNRSGNRSHAIDRHLLSRLTPANTPPFAYTHDQREPFVFFQDLNTFHGVNLPAGVPDPMRLYLDVALILGFGDLGREVHERRPEIVGRQLQRYRESHPYADPMVISLINPDQGDFLAGAIEEMVRREAPSDEDGDASVMPALDVTGYVVDGRSATLSVLDRFRDRHDDAWTQTRTDALLPAVSTTIRSLSEFDMESVRPAHLAIAADLTRPRIGTLSAPPDEATLGGSLSLYGLIARFTGDLTANPAGIAWHHRLVHDPGLRSDPHPAGPRFGDVLIETHVSLLRAGGRLLTPESSSETTPVVEVAVDEPSRALLERLHASADWVITTDRFFGVEYYDSPHEPALADLAQKHVIDYAPEFADGLGHRTVVTTAWRDEIALQFRRTMDELGFASVDRSVRSLLHYLKIASGRLVLQAAQPTTTGAAAGSLGAVLAWLRVHGHLSNAVLVPVDPHAELFSLPRASAGAESRRRCDLVLFTLRRGIVEATFIEVKWRRGEIGNLDTLADDMHVQMRVTADAVAKRFFDPDRIDGALQRAHLANVLRFYCRRAARYGLLDPDAQSAFLTHLNQLERSGLTFRPSFEGFIVSLDRPAARPLVQGNLTVRLLTAQDFEEIDPLLLHTPAPPDEPASGGSSQRPNSRDAEVKDASLPRHEEGRPHNAADTAGDDNGTEASEADAPGGAELCCEVDIVLAQSLSGEVVWKPRVSGSPHLFITGIPGQGKSWTIMRILLELAKYHVPALVFDFHGQLGDGTNPFARSAQPTVLDAAIGLPFSPFECDTESMATGWQATAFGIAEIVGSVCGLGDIQRDALYQCIRDSYIALGFEDAAPGEVLPYPSLTEILWRIEKLERQQRTNNLAARLRPLLEFDIFRPPEESRSSLISAIKQGLVIDLHQLPSEMLQTLVGAFVLRKIYRDMFRWGMADRIRLVIVLDEAHRLARDVSLPLIMKEGRKFGVAVVVASQGIGDFHPDVLNNAGTKIAFRANHLESRRIAGFFSGPKGRNLVHILEGLSVGTALVQTPDMTSAVRASMVPPDQGPEPKL